MPKRSTLAYLATAALLCAAAPRAFCADPPACVVSNTAFTETWTITVADKYVPVGVIKFYDLSGKALATIQSAGDSFTLNRKDKVAMVVCPSPKGDFAIGITLAFAKKGNEKAPCTILNIKQMVTKNGVTAPVFTYKATCDSVKVNEAGYQNPDKTFVTVGL